MTTSPDARQVRRFELYTRASFYLILPVLHGSAALSFVTAAHEAPGPGPSGTLVFAGLAGVAAHAVASAALAAWAFRQQQRLGPVPLSRLLSFASPDAGAVGTDRRRLAAYVALTALVVGVLVAASEPATLYEVGAASYTPAIFVLGAGLSVLGLRMPWSAVGGVGLVGFALVLAGFAARGIAWPGVVGIGVFGGIVLVFLSGTGTLTWWMLDVVRTLARSRTTLARLAVAEERLRFSRDLHDVYGRTLSTIAMKSQLAAELARRGDERAVGEMVGVHELAQTSLADARRIVSGYREIDPGTELAGARSVLRSAGARLVESGVETALGRLDGPGRTAAAWVLREATTNVLRHADASTVRVTGAVDGANVTLTVTNDGVSGDEGADPGTGLLGLSERLREIGGGLDTAAGDGTFVLTATLPAGASARPTSEENP